MIAPSRRSLADALFLAGIYILLSLFSLSPFSTQSLTAATIQPSPQTPASSTSPTPPPLAAPIALPLASPIASPSPTATTTETNQPTLATRDIPEIQAKISLPKEWCLLPGKLLEGDVLIATREKITSENDSWTTGLSMTIDRNGPKNSGQKASDYAMALAREAREKAGEEASPLKESQSGPFHDIRFDFPLASEPPLIVTEILRANDTTGTLAVIIWQMPKEESSKLQPLRDAILSGLTLNPAQ